MKHISAWIEAMRLRTLPVSVAGVVTACGYAAAAHSLRPKVAALCLAFAVLAQIASNFANEYFDFSAGLDRKGRSGPRRGVTEGDITPGAMLAATFITLGCACAIGLGLVSYGGWWLIPMGAIITLGALAYSAGPFPLSHHALGEVAVLLFFGVIPVCLTYWLQVYRLPADVMCASVAIGLMGCNVLLVNNFRDLDDDREVGKRTLSVLVGRTQSAYIYLFSGFIAVGLTIPTWSLLPTVTWIVPGAYLVGHTSLWLQMLTRHEEQLNPLLGITAMLMLAYAISLAVLLPLLTL